MALARVYTNIGSLIIRKLLDDGGPPAQRVSDELDSIVNSINAAAPFFTYTWFVPDPTTPTLSTFNFPFTLNPTGALGVTLTRLKVLYGTGTHTAGGSVTFSLFVDGVSAATLALNDTNNAALTIYENNFADDATWTSATMSITARAGTVSERNVSVLVEGFQKIA